MACWNHSIFRKLWPIRFHNTFLLFMLSLVNVALMTISTPFRLILLASGWVSLILGIIGIFLPLLPTTPFILLSAYCFSKSSPRLHHWLIHQPHLGPMIQNWEQQGSISQSAKVTSTVLIIGLFGFSLLSLNLSFLIKGALICMGIGVLGFIWTRPLPLRHLDQFSNGSTHTREDLVRLG